MWGLPIWTQFYENQTIPGRERLDLVIKNRTNVYVADLTIPFENGKDAFKEARKRKQV